MHAYFIAEQKSAENSVLSDVDYPKKWFWVGVGSYEEEAMMVEKPIL
jgi:hypothetical protein